MKQLSIIYLIICAVLLVGITLIALSPDPLLDLFPDADTVYALSTIKVPGSLAGTENGSAPLYFFPNNGEVDECAKYYARTSEYTLWMTSEGLVFDSIKKAGGEDNDTPRPSLPEEDLSRLLFLNANKKPDIIPLDITRVKDVSASLALLYKDIYTNIDLKISGCECQIEYTWIVKPGGNPGDIRFEYKNVRTTGIDNRWDLSIETQYGKLIHKKPVSYQLIGGEKIDINSHYEPIKNNTYGFKIKAYNSDYALIIDPLVSFELSANSLPLGAGINDR